MAKVIYKPKGKAGEYIPDGYALNIYSGCYHACEYCYCPQLLYKKKEEFFSKIEPRKDILQRLEKELPDHKGDKIFLSFTSDPYQPLEHIIRYTETALQMMLEHDCIPVVLTKGEVPLKDFKLFQKFKEFHFGVTLTHLDCCDNREEVRAMSPHYRMNLLKVAKEHGINTWVSLEPVINPSDALDVIKNTYPVVDHYKIGKINYTASDVDWGKFYKEVVKLLDKLGCNYYIKESLKQYE